MKNVLSILGNVVAIIMVLAIVAAFTALGVWGVVLLLGAIGLIRLYGPQKAYDRAEKIFRVFAVALLAYAAKISGIVVLAIAVAATISVTVVLGTDALVFLLKSIGNAFTTVGMNTKPLFGEFSDPLNATKNGFITAIFTSIILGWFTIALFCHAARKFDWGQKLENLNEATRNASRPSIEERIKGKISKQAASGVIDNFLAGLVGISIWTIAKIVETIHILNFASSAIKKICNSDFIDRYFLKSTSNSLIVIGLLGTIIVLGFVLIIGTVPLTSSKNLPISPENIGAMLGVAFFGFPTSPGDMEVMVMLRAAFFLGILGILMGSAFRFIHAPSSADNKSNTSIIKFLSLAAAFGLTVGLSLLIVFFLSLQQPWIWDYWYERQGKLEERHAKLEKWEARLARREAELGEGNTQRKKWEARLAELEERHAELEKWEARLVEWDAELEEGFAALAEREADLEEEFAALEKWASELADSQIILSNDKLTLSNERMILSNELETLRRYYVALADDNLGPLAKELANLAERLKELTIKVEQPLNVVVKNLPEGSNLVPDGIEREIYEALKKEFDKRCGGLEVVESTSRSGVRIVFPKNLLQFATDESIPQEGFKEALECFFPPFIAVLKNEKFRGEIGEIRIQGHASSVWEKAETGEDAYFNNMRLSQERTRETLRHVLPQEYGDDHKCWPRYRIENFAKENPAKTDPDCWLLRVLTADGWSSGRAVPDSSSDGENDKASRRIEFEVRALWRKELGN